MSWIHLPMYDEAGAELGPALHVRAETLMLAIQGIDRTSFRVVGDYAQAPAPGESHTFTYGDVQGHIGPCNADGTYSTAEARAEAEAWKWKRPCTCGARKTREPCTCAQTRAPQGQVTETSTAGWKPLVECKAYCALPLGHDGQCTGQECTDGEHTWDIDPEAHNIHCTKCGYTR